MSKSTAANASAADVELARVQRELAAWIRHGEAVPSDVTTYPRDAVNIELREIMRDRRES